MDANIINEIEASNPTAETIELINHWREIVKPGIYRLTGGNGNVTINQKSYVTREES